MEIIDELYEALHAGNAEKLSQILLAQKGHDILFDLQVDYEENLQRKAYLHAIKKTLPLNFIRDFVLTNNPFNLANASLLFPEKIGDLFMSFLICAIEEDDLDALNQLHAIEPKDSETIGGYLDGYGHSLIQGSEFSKAIKVYDLALKFKSPGESVYANALWIAQKDNTNLPVDVARNNRWLEICIPHGPTNPGILFNAACIYMEHHDYEKVTEFIKHAIHYGAAEGPEKYGEFKNMAADVMFDTIREKVDAIFNSPPKGVNAKAWWSDEEGEWVHGEKDANGLFQGIVQYWRPGGTLCCETEHIDGQPNGLFTRFHESGEVSRRGRLLGSQLIGSDTAFRSYDFTSEKAIPEQVPLPVHSVETFWENGNFTHQVLRNLEGDLLTPTGNKVPNRPQSVPEDAFFLNDIWQSGIYSKETDKVGEWLYFHSDGSFLKEEFYQEGIGYSYTILQSDRTDAAYEKGAFSNESWMGIVSLLDENKKVLGTYDSTGADLVKDQKMLEWIARVRAVEWKELESAYEDTSPVGHNLIVFAIAEDSEIRDEAVQQLYNRLYHDETTYEASATAIPLLVSLSTISKTEEMQMRPLIFVEQMALMPRGKYDHWTKEGYAFECVDAISNNAYQLMASYSASENPHQKTALLNCLAAGFKNPDIALFLNEENENMEDYAVQIAALGNLKAISPEMIASIETMPHILQLALIYGCALWWDGPGISNALPIILDLLDDENINEIFYKFPCVDGGIIEELPFLLQADENSILAYADVLLDRIESTTDWISCTLIEAALRTVFAKEDFAIHQGNMLRALVAQDNLWLTPEGEDVRVLEFIEVLDSWEFPNTRDALAEFATQWPSE